MHLQFKDGSFFLIYITMSRVCFKMFLPRLYLYVDAYTKQQYKLFIYTLKVYIFYQGGELSRKPLKYKIANVNHIYDLIYR